MQKGTICVIREYQGNMVIMPIEKQWAYKEWSGCFSIIWESIAETRKPQSEGVLFKLVGIFLIPL
jgi:hypothetical protein